MALIDQNNVIFYHPLDDRQEFTQSQNWIGDIDFVPAKVVSGAAPTNVVDEFVFGSGHYLDQTTNNTDRPCIVKLDDDTVLINYGQYAVTADISGTVIATGTKIVNPTIRKLTTAHKLSYDAGSGYALLTSYDSHPSVKTQANFVQINGSTISSVESKNFVADYGTAYSTVAIAILNSGSNALIIDDSSTNAMILSFSGGGFSSGVSQSVAPNSTPHDAAPISSSGALVMFQTGKAYIVNCDFDNDIVNFGSEHIFSTTLDNFHPTGHWWHGKALCVSDNKVLLVYRRGSALFCRIAEVSGENISFGDEIKLALGTDPWENSWEAHFINTSLLSPDVALVSYVHELNNEDFYLKYHALTIDGNSISKGDERIWGTDYTLHNLSALSPSSVVGGYRLGGGSAYTDVRFYVGEPKQKIDVGISGVNYPSISGYDHIATAMWVQNPFPTSGTEEILLKFGYHTRIKPSAITFGDDTTLNFVGSLSHGFMEGGDDDHEGHSGEDTDFILTNVSGYLDSNNADIILLHIGTNDIAVGTSPSTIKDNISGICEKIWEWGTINSIDTRIVLAKITNWTDPSSASGLATTELNGLLQTLGNDFNAAGQSISVVDMENALTYPDDISDNVHPTVSGYEKMANTWYPTIINQVQEIRQTTGSSGIRIMPLGDSITKGNPGNEGYRMVLQTLLSSGLYGERWTGSAVENVASGINDGSDHFLIMDFQNTASQWNLKTSLDGADWVNHGTSTTGLQSILSSSGFTPGIYMTDGSDNQWLDEVAVWGGDFNIFTSGELADLYALGQTYGLPLSQYTNTFKTVSGSVDLYTSGSYASSTGEIDFYMQGPILATSGSDLYIKGPLLQTSGINLFMSSPRPSNGSTNLFITGPAAQPSGQIAQIVDYFIKQHDYNPQIIGRFDTIPASAVIRIWNIIDGVNTRVSLTDDTCYRIGSTKSWGWSTANLPTISGTNQQFFYTMTSSLEETFDGQFFINVPEDARWLHPSDSGSYIKRI